MNNYFPVPFHTPVIPINTQIYDSKYYYQHSFYFLSNKCFKINLMLLELILKTKNAVHYTTKYDWLSQDEISSHLKYIWHDYRSTIVKP